MEFSGFWADLGQICKFDNSLGLFPFFMIFPVFGRGVGIIRYFDYHFCRTKTEQE